MRCTHCGYQLDEEADACPRCGADLRVSARVHAALGSLFLLVAAMAVAALVTYYVLSWHDLQRREGTAGADPAQEIALITS